MYHLPIYTVKLVRDGTQKSEVKKVRSARDVYEIVCEYLDGADREYFGVIMLDTQNNVRGITTVSMGVLNASLVHPREVFKPAILASAANIILFHNHPSGDSTPSAEDRAVTRQLKQAGVVIGIEVMDHVVVGDGSYISFAETGLIS